MSIEKRIIEKIDYTGGKSSRERGAWQKQPRQTVKPGSMNVLGAVRQAILEVLGPLMQGSQSDKEELVYTSTFLPEEDPGERTHKSYNGQVIVYHDVPDMESYDGVPPPFGHVVEEEPESPPGFPIPPSHYYVTPGKAEFTNLMDAWMKVGKRAAELSGKKVIWNEPWNEAVSAMYVEED